MAKISFLKARAAIKVATGGNLMRSLLAAGVPVASSCDGDGICGKCRIRIFTGSENLTPATPLEKKLREKESLSPDERISCQARIRGDIVVDTTYW